MNLNEYQDTFWSLLDGTLDGGAAATALYGDDDGLNPVRLSDYRAGYLGAQNEGLSIQHPQTRAVLEARQGRDAWRALVERYLAAHPPDHPHRIVAFAPFPDFVAQDATLPPWLGDLARLERAALLADVGPDAPEAPADPETRVLALGWDVLAWNADGAPDLRTDPERRCNLVLTWRAEDGSPLQAEVGPVEELALIVARRGEPATDEEREAIGATEDELAAALEALVEIGAVRRLSLGA